MKTKFLTFPTKISPTSRSQIDPDFVLRNDLSRLFPTRYSALQKLVWAQNGVPWKSLPPPHACLSITSFIYHLAVENPSIFIKISRISPLFVTKGFCCFGEVKSLRRDISELRRSEKTNWVSRTISWVCTFDCATQNAYIRCLNAYIIHIFKNVFASLGFQIYSNYFF